MIFRVRLRLRLRKLRLRLRSYLEFRIIVGLNER